MIDMKSLAADGFYIHRHVDVPIKDVCIFGERSTGTNLLNIVLKSSFGFQQAKDYGWKHGPPSFLAARDSTLFVVSLRDAIDWSISLYARPRNALVETLGLSYRDFIQSPWHSVIPDGKNPNYPPGATVQPDLHPISGKPYDTIFKMREVKTKSWLSLARRHVNLVVVRHETFMQDRPRCLSAIADQFDLKVAPQGLEDVAYFFKKRAHEERRRAVAARDAARSRELLDKLIDWDFEAARGYDAGTSGGT